MNYPPPDKEATDLAVSLCQRDWQRLVVAGRVPAFLWVELTERNDGDRVSLADFVCLEHILLFAGVQPRIGFRQDGRAYVSCCFNSLYGR